MKGNKEKALAALLSNPTRKAAAKAAGIAERTLRDYFKDPEFAAAYRQAYNEMLQDAAAEGKQLLHQSMQTIKEVMQNGDTDATRVTAARSAFEYTLKLTEQTDILTQLEELKRAVFPDEN